MQGYDADVYEVELKIVPYQGKLYVLREKVNEGCERTEEYLKNKEAVDKRDRDALIKKLTKREKYLLGIED